MKTIVPSPRGQVRAAAAASLPVLARIPDVLAPEPAPKPESESIAPPQQPETKDVPTKQANNLPPQPEKSKPSDHAATDRVGHRDAPQERPRQQRLPHGRSSRPSTKKSTREVPRRKLPSAGYLVAGLVGLLLIVVIVLMTRNNKSAPDTQQAPSWPSDHDGFAGTDPQHNHDHQPGEVGGADPNSPPSHPSDDMVGMQPQDAMPPNFGTQFEQSSEVPPPGVVRLNGTIDKPDLQAQQPSENGVNPTR